MEKANLGKADYWDSSVGRKRYAVYGSGLTSMLCFGVVIGHSPAAFLPDGSIASATHAKEGATANSKPFDDNYGLRTERFANLKLTASVI